MEWIFKKFDELTTVELYKILQAREAVFALEQNCLYRDCDNKDLGAFHLFAHEDGEIAAYVRILDKHVSYEEPSIGRVLVTHNFRSRGLGKEIMRRAISHIEEYFQERQIRISAQSYLIRFYSEMGFKRVGVEYMEDNIPHTQMLYSR